MPRRIRPVRIAIGLTAVLGAVALARSATSQYEARREALERATEANRAKLHLNVDAACQQDATPEITFRDAKKVHPGEHFHVVIPGKFRGTSGAYFLRDDVTVSSIKSTKAGVELDAQVAPTALPGAAELEVARALCPRADEVSVAEVVAKTRWNVKYPNGWSVELTCVPDKRAEDDTNCDAVWSGKGGPKTTRARLGNASDGNFNADFRLTRAEGELLQKQMEQTPREPPPELMARLQKSQEEIGKCGKLPQEKQMPCLTTASAEAQKIAQEWEDTVKKNTPPAGPPGIGCTSAFFEVDGTTVTATGHECGKAGADLEGGKGTVQIQG